MSSKPSLLNRCIAEAIGTGAVVLFGCGAIILASRGQVSASVIPLVFGLIVSAMIYALGHISGAHFNPAVSFGFLVVRHFAAKDFIAYVAAQFTGSLLAVLLLRITFPASLTYGATTPSVSPEIALVWECVLSFFLMLVILSVATDTRAVGTMAGAAIGAMIMVGAFVGGPLTGGSMNPARSLAPAIAGGEYASLWIYFAGPTVGTAIGALTYRVIGVRK
jgi:aquaporin NIP